MTISAQSNPVVVVHVYHWGWDCVCEAERHGSGGFQAIIRCKSLMADKATAQEQDSQIYETAGQAIEHAAAFAIKWIFKHRDHLGPALQGKAL